MINGLIIWLQVLSLGDKVLGIFDKQELPSQAFFFLSFGQKLHVKFSAFLVRNSFHGYLLPAAFQKFKQIDWLLPF